MTSHWRRAGSLLLVAVAAFASGLLLGRTQSRPAAAIARVTPARLANAMAADSFYAQFGDKILLVHGTVHRVLRGATGTSVEFQTHGGLRVLCEMEGPAASVAGGQTVTVITQGASAERAAQAVVLVPCALP